MRTQRSTRTPRTTGARTITALAALTLAAAAGLTGCAAVDAVAYGYADAEYSDRDALLEARGDAVSWVPADADDIRLRSSVRDGATDAVVALRSTGALTGCVETERLSAPTWHLDGAPDVYAADTVWACGDWSVAASDDGWYGWTPNDDEERAAAAFSSDVG